MTEVAARRGTTSFQPEPSPLGRIGRYRWTICALLFFSTTISYVDRQVIGLLGPVLQSDLHWNEQQFANVVSWLTVGYGLGFVFAGSIMDRFGVRKGLGASVVVRSIAAMAHAFVTTTFGFSFARFTLGLGESGNFPAAIKGVAEWFPARERAFATGIFNAGSNVGAVITPIMVPWITLRYGWRASFIVIGVLGFVWLVAWAMIYRPPQEHPNVGAAELAHIQSDPIEVTTPVRWSTVLRLRQTWAFAIGKLMTDPIWWFYLYWLPKFLDSRYHIKFSEVTAPLVIIYLLADVGSVYGGWLSGALMKRGWSVNAGRKITMLIPAVIILPTMFAPAAPTMWIAVLIVGVAAAAHQWWSANLFTLTSDMFPRSAVGSVVGIGGLFGAVGGTLFQRATGWVLQHNGSNYTPIFFVCGTAYVAALLLIHLLSPRLERAPIAA